MNLKQRIYNRLIYHTILRRLELKNRNKNNIDPLSTLLIFASPRGGSTWLVEILKEIPKSVLALEPLFRGKLMEFSNLNFFWHQPIPSGIEWKDAENAFMKLLNREILRLSIYYDNNLLDIPKADKFIFKFCHGNMLLEWVTENFDVTPILLVRHPCAVVSSQLLHGGWQGLKNGNANYDIPDFPHNDIYLHYQDILKAVKTVEENLAATWALTMVNSLKSESNDIKWITVAYENLYLNFEYEINRIFGRLGIAIPPSVYGKRQKRSKTTIKSSETYLSSGKQLESWQKNLTNRQQKNILDIIKEFNIDCYDCSLVPNLNEIYVRN